MGNCLSLVCWDDANVVSNSILSNSIVRFESLNHNLDSWNECLRTNIVLDLDKAMLNI